MEKKKTNGGKVMEKSTVTYVAENGFLYRIEPFRGGRVIRVKLGLAKDVAKLVGGCF